MASQIDTAADLPAVVEAFHKCRRSDGSLATDHYLAAVNELLRLFHHFGKSLDFALYGIEKSVKSLEILRVKGAGCNYSTFDLLLKHEKDLHIDQNNNKYGTSHVFKLYHYMSFMLHFLRKLEDCLENNKVFKTKEKIAIYQNTTAKIHAVHIQATAKIMLLKTLERHQLLQKLGQGGKGIVSPREVLRDILTEGYPVQEELSKLLAE